MRDSGLDISFALRQSSIKNQSISYKNAIKNNFIVDTYEKLIPDADLVINLTLIKIILKLSNQYAVNEKKFNFVLFSWF